MVLLAGFGWMVDVLMTSIVVCGSGCYVYTYEVDT